MFSYADRRTKIKSEIAKLRVALLKSSANTPKKDAYKISLEKSHCIGKGWKRYEEQINANIASLVL